MSRIPLRIPLRIRLLVPGNVRHNSGGNVYNSRLARELAAMGAAVEVLPVDGSWPVGSKEERRRLAGYFEARNAGAGETVAIVDGLIACGAPEQLEDAAAAGHRVWILLHMALKEHPDLEERALRAVTGVICTSSSAAAETSKLHNLAVLHVALPGTDAAELAAGSDPPHLTAVAALLPNKDQLLTVGALAQLQDLPWTAALVGSDSAHPGYSRQVLAAVERLGIQDRVRVTGQLTGEALELEWRAADLSLLVSRAETFGLVVNESLARGIPVVVRAGTGAVEALELASRQGEGQNQALPGTAVELGIDSAPLAQVLRRWLTDPEVRADWRTAALVARGRLPGWEATARRVADIVRGQTRLSPFR